MSATTPFTLTVHGSSLRAIFAGAGSMLQEELVKEMTEILTAQGYSVTHPAKWESPKEISARLNISLHKFWYRMQNPLCPKPYDLIRDNRGINALRSHPVLDAFLQNKRSQPS